MDLTQSLMVGLVTGVIGMGYFVYGKKTQRPVPLIAGLLLLVYPYFIDSLPWAVLIGVVLTAVPFVIRGDGG